MSMVKATLKRFGWFIHLSIFLFFQVLFYLFDGASIWFILNLNDGGEKVYRFMETFFYPFLPYETEQLNYFTVFWLVAVLLHGFSEILLLIKEKPSQNK